MDLLDSSLLEKNHNGNLHMFHPYVKIWNIYRNWIRF